MSAAVVLTGATAAPSRKCGETSATPCPRNSNDWRNLRKDDISLAKQIALKRLRNRVRLEAAIRADIVLNELLPEFEREFDRRVAAGEPYELETYEEWVVQAVDRQLPRGRA